MIRHAHRGINVRGTIFGSLVLSGAAFALVAAGCSSGGSSSSNPSNPSNPDTALAAHDAPPTTPDLTPTGPDAAPIPVDMGAGGAGGSDAAVDRGGNGGSAGIDSGIDLGSGGSGGIDSGIDLGSGLDAGGDGNLDQGIPSTDASASEAGAGAIDASGVDGGNLVDSSADGGYSACQTPIHAWTYGLSALTNIAWDVDGNLVTAASVRVGLSQFAGKPLTTYGGADVLVAKLDPATGNAVWVQAWGDVDNQTVTSMAVTSTGLGVIGTFKGTLDIDPTNQVIPPIVNPGTSPVDYIIGLNDSDGTGVWSKKVNLGGGQLSAIAGNPNQDYFIVCGAAMNNAANLNAVGTPGGGKDVVVAAVNVSDGTVKWAKLFGGTMDQQCTAAVLDDVGNVMIAGTYAGALDFGSGALSPAPTGIGDSIMWVAKLNGTTGIVASAKAFGSTGVVTPNALTLDAQGNVIAAGEFTSQVLFGSQTLTPVGKTDAFVAKLDSSLAPLWARRWGRSSSNAACYGAAVDSTGKVTVVGSFEQSADVGPGGAVLQAYASGSPESLVVVLDGSSGETLCASHYGDPNSNSGVAASIAFNRTGANKDRAAIGGAFNKVIEFGGSTTALAPLTTALGSLASYLLEM